MSLKYKTKQNQHRINTHAHTRGHTHMHKHTQTHGHTRTHTHTRADEGVLSRCALQDSLDQHLLQWVRSAQGIPPWLLRDPPQVQGAGQLKVMFFGQWGCWVRRAIKAQHFSPASDTWAIPGSEGQCLHRSSPPRWWGFMSLGRLWGPPSAPPLHRCSAPQLHLSISLWRTLLWHGEKKK